MEETLISVPQVQLFKGTQVPWGVTVGRNYCENQSAELFTGPIGLDPTANGQIRSTLPVQATSHGQITIGKRKGRAKAPHRSSS